MDITSCEDSPAGCLQGSAALVFVGLSAWAGSFKKPSVQMSRLATTTVAAAA